MVVTTAQTGATRDADQGLSAGAVQHAGPAARVRHAGGRRDRHREPAVLVRNPVGLRRRGRPRLHHARGRGHPGRRPSRPPLRDQRGRVADRREQDRRVRERPGHEPDQLVHHRRPDRRPVVERLQLHLGEPVREGIIARPRVHARRHHLGPELPHPDDGHHQPGRDAVHLPRLPGHERHGLQPHLGPHQRPQAAVRGDHDLWHGRILVRGQLPQRGVPAVGQRRRRRRGRHGHLRYAHALQQLHLPERHAWRAEHGRAPRRPFADARQAQPLHELQPERAQPGSHLGALEQPDGRPRHRDVDRRARVAHRHPPGEPLDGRERHSGHRAARRSAGRRRAGHRVSGGHRAGDRVHGRQWRRRVADRRGGRGCAPGDGDRPQPEAVPRRGEHRRGDVVPGFRRPAVERQRWQRQRTGQPGRGAATRRAAGQQRRHVAAERDRYPEQPAALGERHRRDAQLRHRRRRRHGLEPGGFRRDTRPGCAGRPRGARCGWSPPAARRPGPAWSTSRSSARAAC